MYAVFFDIICILLVVALVFSAFGIYFSPSGIVEALGERDNWYRININALWHYADLASVSWGDPDGTLAEKVVYYLGVLWNAVIEINIAIVYIMGLGVNIVLLLGQIMYTLFTGQTETNPEDFPPDREEEESPGTSPSGPGTWILIS